MPEMVFKEDVVKWFKQIKSYRRIDLMCSLLNMCLPFELRYLGTCLEDLGKRDFHDLRDTENRANNVAELSELQCLSDKRTQRKLALYLALLRTCNYPCSNGLFKILSNFDVGEINTIINNNPSDENPLEELLLVYTLALNHPSFTFQQKTVFGNILVRLQEEEAKLATKHLPVGMNVYYAPMQVPCQSSEEPLVVPDVGVGGPCTTLTLPPSNTTGHDLGKGRSPLPPGFGVGLSPDPSTNYMHLLGPPMGHWPVMPPSAQEDVFSRHSSPSPSRASTPPRLRTKDSALVDPLRETLGKEMPGFLPNLQNYSIDELRRMTDEELKELGLSAGAIHQLRSIVTKIHNTNGLCNLEKPPLGSKLVEMDKERLGAQPQPCGGPMDPAGVSLVYPHQQVLPGISIACIIPSTPVAVSRNNLSHSNQLLQLNSNLCSLRLDTADTGRHCSNSSSGSDSSSASHSPPDTPSLQPWDRGYTVKDRPGCEDKQSEEPHNTRPRLGGPSLGRAKSNPPGVQTLPRGRGPMDKSLRSVNGAPPERKIFVMGGDMGQQQPPPRPGLSTDVPYTTATFIPHFPGLRAFPAFPHNSYMRPAYPAELVYSQYPGPQNPPPVPNAFVPPVINTFSTAVPPPKLSCYNCGAHGHQAQDCKEPTMEEITKQGQFRLDYSRYQKPPTPGECPMEK